MSIQESCRLDVLKEKGFYNLNRDELTEFADLTDKAIDVYAEVLTDSDGRVIGNMQDQLIYARKRLNENWV